MRDISRSLPYVACLIACNFMGSCSSSYGGANGGTGSMGSYSIMVSVTGLNGSGLVLQNNRGDSLSVAGDGSFAFPTAVPSPGTEPRL